MNRNFTTGLLGTLLFFMLPLVTISADEPVFSSSVYYRIFTKNGGTRCVDIVGEKSYEGEKLCIWSNIANRTTEDWIVKKVGNYYQFLSRNGGWAINDPTTGEVTATTNTGTQLNLAKVDTTSQSQLWDIVAQSDGYFNIINVYTQHTMNLNGGTNADGTALISYKSDTSNATSQNRQWKFVASDSINGNSSDSVQVDTTKNDTIIRRLSNLPHIYIYTKNGASITSKKTWINASLLYIDENDVVTNYDALQIRGRGNSTWNRNPSKKPYRIKFAEAVEFLGPEYANARNWTLMANTYDKTLMRNGLTSELSEFCGMEFNVAHKYVDVTLNGEYIGTYEAQKMTFAKEKEMKQNLFRAYQNDKVAYEELRKMMIEDGFDEEKLGDYIEAQRKENHSDAEQKSIDSSMQKLEGSNIWKDASEDDKSRYGKTVEKLALGIEDSYTESITKYATDGLTEEQVILYKLALKKVDKPTESGKLGSFTNAEKEEALKLLMKEFKLTQAQKDALKGKKS